MSPRSLKSLSLFAGLVLGGGALLCWTMTWFTVTLTGDDAGHEAIAVTGEHAAPAVAALGLAALALVAAIAIAGPVFRVICGVLEIVLGACIVLASLGAFTDPVSAASGPVTEATGIDGHNSVANAIDALEMSAWPTVAVVVGILMAALGVFILVTAKRWPGASRRYQAVQFEDADAAPANSAGAGRSTVSDWDVLSDGGDPTEPPASR